MEILLYIAALQAVGSGTLAVHSRTASGQWPVGLLCYIAAVLAALPHCLGAVGSGTCVVHCRIALGSGQCNSYGTLPDCMEAVGKGTLSVHRLILLSSAPLP